MAVALAAVSCGGAAALGGLPVLERWIAPDPPSRLAMPIALAGAHSGFSPQVLQPLPEKGFPDWLIERVAALRNSIVADPPAQPVSIPGPAISIVIDDLGPDVAGTRRAIALPAEVTLSFLPYAAATPSLARQAGDRGHEVILHLPMQPEGRDDPGPNALLVGLPAAENVRRLDWALGRVPGADGVNNHMGSRFTQDRASLIPVFDRLSSLHDYFLDSRTGPNTQVIPLARAFGIMSAGRDVFLDDVQTAEEVRHELAEAERIARACGTAIAIGHPHDVTLAVLKEWTARLSGIRLIALREAVRRKTKADLLGAAGNKPSKPEPPPPPKLAGPVED